MAFLEIKTIRILTFEVFRPGYYSGPLSGLDQDLQAADLAGDQRSAWVRSPVGILPGPALQRANQGSGQDLRG